MISLPIYSASQIEAWTDCPRKWAWDKIDRVPKAQGKAALLGERIHKQLEERNKGFQLDFASDSEAAALASLEASTPPGYTMGFKPERAFTERLSHREHQWTGRIDWSVFASKYVAIGDYKSTSDIRKWAKPIDVLEKDIQSNVYAQWAFTIRPDIATVAMRWTYIQTKGAPLVDVRDFTLHRNQVAERFEQIDQTAEQITLTRAQVTTALQVPYNPDACDKYGGCPYQSKCNLSPLERMSSIMSNGADFLARLQTQHQPSNGPTATCLTYQPPSFNPVPQAPHPQAVQSTSWKRDQRGHVTHAYSGRPLPQQVIDSQYVMVTGSNNYVPIPRNDAEITVELAGYIEDAATKHAGEQPSQGWQPPQQQAPQAPQAPTPPQAWRPGTPMQTGPINPPEYQPPPQTAPPNSGMQSPPAPAPAAPSEEPPKKGPGRPRTKQQPAVQQSLPGTPAPAPSKPTSGATPIGCLFLGCVPQSDSIVYLHEVVSQANQVIMKDQQLVDWSLADFGKGPGLLAAYVSALLEASPVENLVVDIDSREGQVLSTRLCAMAGTIVRRI